MKVILGISAYYHDSAAVLIVDGQIRAALQEERLNRIKNTSVFPSLAVKFCLDEYGIDLDEVDAVVFYDKPFLKFERLLENFYANAPKGLSAFLKFMPEWSQKKLFLKKELRRELSELYPASKQVVKLLFSSHHLSHAASAFYPSPFNEAAILTIDAVGEWATASIGFGKGAEIDLLQEMHFPDSVGLLYSSFTYFLGFKVNSGEYKLMGLSPYGVKESDQTKQFVETIKANLLTLFADGSIQLNQAYFKYRHALRMINESKWEKLFAMPRRKEDEALEQSHANLALAIQLVTEEIILKMAKTSKELTGSDNLCLAGGVALNCVANGKLKESNLFANVWVQPAAGDAGGALGAALAVYYTHNPTADLKSNTGQDLMQGALLGPEITDKEVQQYCNKHGLKPRIFSNDSDLCTYVAEQLYANKIVAWVNGKAEFGPRALGARSILASPFAIDMQSKLNLAVKFREDFRPFAPILLKEEAATYFGVDHPAQYMQFVHRIKPEFRLDLPPNYNELNFSERLKVPRSKLQTTTHVDFSSRIQVVDNEDSMIGQLLNKFKSISGAGILVNTSFNRNGEPIVCGLKEAFDCFEKTDLSILVINNHIFEKKE
ncbi:MAG: carbamoyltransferase [Crocinitomix sp.]|jgi:carbamoyltransferase